MKKPSPMAAFLGHRCNIGSFHEVGEKRFGIGGEFLDAGVFTSNRD